MMSSSLTKGTVSYRSGQSFARGVAMDLLLTPKETELLYKKWDPKWPTPYEYPGNNKAITAEQVVEVGLEELTRVYRTKAANIYAIAIKNAVV